MEITKDELAESELVTLPPQTRAGTRIIPLVLGAATIFAAAFLLFSLQPLVGKIVLPRFGGSAAVWSVCLVFFQTALLAGYVLAYGVAKLRPKHQFVVYAILWLAAALLAWIPVGDAWRLTWFDNPAGELLSKLLCHVALPCVMVSSVSVLVQVWSQFAGVKNPYPFYAVSNVGSLGALLAYPILIEPNLPVPASAAAWGWGFRIVAVLVAILGVAVWIHTRREDGRHSVTPGAKNVAAAPPPWSALVMWMFLAAVGSGLLVSFTSRMTQDIAPIPMLWIIPLSLYLLTFILCFGGAYRREWIVPLALIAFAVHTYVTLRHDWPDLGFRTKLFGSEIAASGVTVGLILSSSAFFLLVMLLHGELYAARPSARFLSRYYLLISAGGALGGAFVSLAAPFLFKVQFEYPLLLALALAVLLHVTLVSGVRLLQNYWLNLAVTLGVIVLGIGLTIAEMAKPESLKSSGTTISFYRNVYGPMRVETGSDRKSFLHGTTVHGTQLIASDSAHRPISYYSEQSAFGVVFDHFAHVEKRNPLRIGAIGLGVGTLAAYVRNPRDLSSWVLERSVTFYELDPEVAAIARRHFTYLELGGNDVSIHFGDARTSLEREPSQGFDILVVDAFTGDGIPIHLLTREALELYQRHIKSDGAILFHISNKFLELESVIGNVAHAAGLHALTIDHDAKSSELDGSTYVVVSAQNLPLVSQKWHDGGETNVGLTIRDSGLRIWTDNYSNLFSVLNQP